MNDILLLMALDMESRGMLENVHYTGVGKINASFALMKLLGEKGNPRLVLNLGTAGSKKFNSGQLVACDKFVERDMDVSALGFAAGETPFDSDPPMIQHKKFFPDLPHGVCGSGDFFETSDKPKVPCDVIDMEAFALAKICRRLGIDFAAVKYITDGADGSAAKDWQENLGNAARAFKEFVENQRDS